MLNGSHLHLRSVARLSIRSVVEPLHKALDIHKSAWANVTAHFEVWPHKACGERQHTSCAARRVFEHQLQSLRRLTDAIPTVFSLW